MGAVTGSAKKIFSGIKEDPLRAIAYGAAGALTGPVGLAAGLSAAGIQSSNKMGAEKRAKTAAANNLAIVERRAAADVLNAEESVRAQKERARKQTVFGGSLDSNLFNKSLIGASTTAAAGTQRSILGA
jgi:hypothetical protein